MRKTPARKFEEKMKVSEEEVADLLSEKIQLDERTSPMAIAAVQTGLKKAGFDDLAGNVTAANIQDFVDLISDVSEDLPKELKKLKRGALDKVKGFIKKALKKVGIGTR